MTETGMPQISSELHTGERCRFGRRFRQADFRGHGLRALELQIRKEQAIHHGTHHTDEISRGVRGTDSRLHILHADTETRLDHPPNREQVDHSAWRVKALLQLDTSFTALESNNGVTGPATFSGQNAVVRSSDIARASRVVGMKEGRIGD
jgi:hypothetical protein